jgi:DNA repair exonuclease SbcCD ATPase subunit
MCKLRNPLLLRNPRIVVSLIPLLLFCWLLGTGTLPNLQAADADTLAKQANAELRSAEREFFDGKLESADTRIAQAAKLLEELRKADASHRNLKSLEAKHQKLRKDLDRRLGKTTSTSAPVPVATTKPADASTSSHAAPGTSGAMNRDLQKAVKDVDYSLGRFEALMAKSESSTISPPPIEQSQQQAERYIADARGYLSKLEAKYGDQLPTSSTELQTARDRITAAEQDAELWVARLRDKAGAEADAKSKAERSAAETQAKAEADAGEMLALYQEFGAALEPMHGNSLVYGIALKDAEKALEQIETVEKQVLPKLAPQLGRLAEEYGKDSMTIGNRLFAMGFKGQGDPGGKLSTLITAVGNISASRRSSAATVLQNAETLLSAFSTQLTDARIQRMNDVKALLVLGRQLDPGNEALQKQLERIDDQIADVAERMEKEINARTWAGQVDAFAGPGDVRSLSQAALEYFRKDKDWGGNPNRKIEVLAVCVRGPWKVAERDIFGRVIRWRLPIHTAVSDEKLRPRNLARVYELSIVAEEGAPDHAPQAPPFDGYWVGNSWMMRPDKL